MGKQELVEVLNKTSEIKKLLTPMGGSFMPNVKTINGKLDFQIWKTELEHQLRQLKQEPLIVEIIQLLGDGFKNGATDEKDFITLQGKISTLLSHIDEYFEETKESATMNNGQRLKKGTIVKTAFDEYTLIKQIGEGGNGRVFSATNNTGELVAIKFVERNIGGDKLKRFKNELSFCEHHQHKNIVKIYDRGYMCLDEKEYVFYIMPLYAETLENKIKSGIPHEQILNIFIGLLEGLRFAHEQGCIHRDIKPKNIMFATDSFDPIICDFGIAHFAEKELHTIVETKATDRMANFYYAAPEQYRYEEKVYPQTDIYAVALILNEMFTGEIVQAAGYKRIKDINEDYAFLDDVFDQLFMQNPEERLFPENKILTEIKVREENYKRGKEKAALESSIIQVADAESFEAKITTMKYENGKLVFYFNTELPDDWVHMIKFDSYSCTYMMNYDKNLLQRVGKIGLSMRLLGGESEDTIKTLVKHVSEWVKTVNSRYTAQLKQNAEYKQKQEEARRLAEIKRLENETKLNNTVNSILADMQF